MISLSKNEKNVLFSLLDDASLSDKNLSDLYDISCTAVANIRKKLELLVIDKYSISINPCCLGFNFFSLVLFKVDELKMREVRASPLYSQIMSNSLYVYKILNNSVNRILMLPFSCISDFHESIKKVNLEFPDLFSVNEIHILPVNACLKSSLKDVYKSSLNDLSFNEISSKNFDNSSSKVSFCDCDNISLSDNEIEILKCLSNNARMSISSIAQSLNLSVAGVSKIIKKLINSNVITSFDLYLKHDVLNLDICAMFFVHLNSVDKSVEGFEEFLKFLKGSGFVHNIFEISDFNSNFVFSCKFRKLDDVSNFYELINTKFNGVCTLNNFYVFSNASILKHDDGSFFYDVLSNMNKSN